MDSRRFPFGTVVEAHRRAGPVPHKMDTPHSLLCESPHTVRQDGVKLTGPGQAPLPESGSGGGGEVGGGTEY